VLENGVCRAPPVQEQLSTSELAAFVQRFNLTPRGRYEVWGHGYGLVHYVRYVWTELDATNAEAWATGESPMIGAGLALHLVPDDTHSQTRDFAGQVITWSADLSNLTGPDGRCLPGLTPKKKEGQHQLAVYRWKNGEAVAVACAKAGSLVFKYDGGLIDVTVNALFPDGTTVRRELTMGKAN
jgi:hypothetical protein